MDTSADDALLAKPAELELTDVHCSLSEAAAAGVYSVSSTSTVEIGIVSGGGSRLMLMGMFFGWPHKVIMLCATEICFLDFSLVPIVLST